MSSPIDTDIKAMFWTFWLAHWPVFILLILTCWGGLWAQDYASSVVLAVGAAGLVIFLPLCKMEKSLWLYIAAFFMGIANDVSLNDARYITSIMGIEWLSPLAASIIFVAVQGAFITFVLLLFCMIIYRRQVSLHLLVKIPVCMLFLLAALDPAFTMFWLFLGLCGFFGPI
ncbi:hypothetical protein [uncultured Desulfovibrio sp.]|uniref:hypothetical protein n=1 Tax=uncultured Desulfovibrio sp. TaxID=167968 RepID=UPI00260CB10D|nr:hypothetical protein [uncultured Desulfovibrio sp.]